MRIEVRKLTGLDTMRELIEFATPSIDKSEMDLKLAYKRGHTTIRTQLFLIKMAKIPSFVSTHLVRHSSTGQYHFVSSNRDDWGGDKDANRLTLVNHSMILNSEHLIDMSSVRLCGASHFQTMGVMRAIKDEVSWVDGELAKMMVPKCYRNAYCSEAKSCGQIKSAGEWRLENYG